MSLRRAPAAVAALSLLLFAGSVAAHASLVESEPPDGGTLAITPATMTATFDEELGTDRSRIVVRNENGAEVARGGISPTDSRVLTVDLPALPAGSYVASWVAVTPDDGGVERGEITFTVAAGPQSPDPQASVLPTASPTSRPQGIPVITAPPGTTPPPTRAPTPSPAPVLAPSPTVAPQPTLATSPSPSPAGTSGESDLLVALLLAGIAVGGLAVFLLRRGG